MTNQSDLAGVEHWNEVSQEGLQELEFHVNQSYQAYLIEQEIAEAVRRSAAKTILEIGCGNSIWLPYFAKQNGVQVAGLDYSGAACELARRQLARYGVDGQIYCRDLFQTTPADIGQYDLVYSLGVVEHFGNLDDVLARLLLFVKPGGWLLTEVPNLKSMHGLLSWLWQPEVYAMHRPLTARHLVEAYRQLGLQQIEAHFAGIFSLGIVAWEHHPRWPRLARRLTPRIRRVVAGLDTALRRTKLRRGWAPLAPYLCVVGRRPSDAN